VKVIQARQLAEAVTALEAGELVIVPTSRWYMICANARNGQACQKIFDAKRRLAAQSLLLITPHLDAATVQFVFPRGALRLAAAFWPGELAMTLRWREPATGSTHQSVGNPDALVTCAPGVLGELAATAKVPVAATSANVSGESAIGGTPPAITVREVEQFVQTSGVDVAFCVDGGTCPAAEHLTVVDCTTDNVQLVRPGLVHARALSAVLDF
jgi:L-threonylcarbamoyladenylate synthase